MTIENAIAGLNEIRKGYKSLWEARDIDGTDCFWCCGGGDNWRLELRKESQKILDLFPDLIMHFPDLAT
jgi:hypothetical protein